jgi:hypothetical protein
MTGTTLDFSAFIADRTRDFTGREWVFAETDRRLADPQAPRFFIPTGELGIGKTAIAARSPRRGTTPSGSGAWRVEYASPTFMLMAHF